MVRIEPAVGHNGCASGEVHVWRVELGLEPSISSSLEALLSADERRRAARFCFDRLRQRWIQARGTLRLILAPYVDMLPEAIAFDTGPQGKPSIAGEPNSIRFNLSHTDHVALIAITTAVCVGVDAESIRPGIDCEGLSRRFFLPAEAEELQSTPDDLRLDAFFACWTRKEAFIKATGMGLSMPLDSFQVTTHPGLPPRLLWVEGSDVEPSQWQLRDLSEPGVAAALAVRNPSAVVTRLRGTLVHP